MVTRKPGATVKARVTEPKRPAAPPPQKKSSGIKVTVREPKQALAPKQVVSAKIKPRHAFTVSHYNEADFRPDGLRRYAKYRDLGISKATKGMAQAHVIRFIPPCRPEEVSKLHYHDVDFQMIYVLKGSITTELEGQGAVTMKAGSCWLQPPRIKHVVLDYSDDCEVLEIVLPADFKTVELS
jgi:mannose-6-phosphate isomerase-like protein (cupin superfamily)